MRRCLPGRPRPPSGRRPRLFLLTVFLATSQLTVGCRGEMEPGDPGFSLEVGISPTPPAVGPARLIITLIDSAGAPVEGAEIVVEGNMSHAGMVPVLDTADVEGPGRYGISDFDSPWRETGSSTLEANLPDGRIGENPELDECCWPGRGKALTPPTRPLDLRPPRPADLPATKPRDLLKAPVLGPFFRWRHSRSVLQALLLGIAVLGDGGWILGAPTGAQEHGRRPSLGSLAGIRGPGSAGVRESLLYGLPLHASPEAGQEVFPAAEALAQGPQDQVVGSVLLFVFLWAYEAFDLWSSPLLTAWLALAYFAAAFVIDGFFRGAAFCKHVCPIGQFHFVNSLASPLEVGIREPDVCARPAGPGTAS